MAAKLLARVAWLEAESGRYAEVQGYGGAGDAARGRFADLPLSGIVEAVQRELTRVGFDPGPIDGLPGQRTEAAIAAFAAANAQILPEELTPLGLLGELVRRPDA